MKNHLSRSFIILIISLVFVLSGGCTPAPKTFTVGVLNLGPVLEPVLEGFKEEMTNLGYVEGENITYIYNGPAGSVDNLGVEGQRLLDANVDLVLALSTPAALTMQKLTTEVPIVFAPIFDPIKPGLVQSISKPGGNLTGVQWGVVIDVELEWLLKLAPGTSRIYIPYNPDDQSPVLALARVQEVAKKLGVELVLREARTEEEISAAIQEIPEDVDAIFLLPDNLIASHMEELASVSIARKLPMSTPTGELASAGGLFSYSFSFQSSGQKAAKLADQILNGTPPAELPVETDEFFLIINLKVANEIGLTIPDQYLLQADEVIR